MIPDRNTVAKQQYKNKTARLGFEVLERAENSNLK